MSAALLLATATSLRTPQAPLGGSGRQACCTPATVDSWLKPLDRTEVTSSRPLPPPPPPPPPRRGAGPGEDPKPTNLPPWLGCRPSGLLAFSYAPPAPARLSARAFERVNTHHHPLNVLTGGRPQATAAATEPAGRSAARPGPARTAGCSRAWLQHRPTLPPPPAPPPPRASAERSAGCRCQHPAWRGVLASSARTSSRRAKKLSFCAADVSSCEREYSLPLWKPLLVAIAPAERTCCAAGQRFRRPPRGARRAAARAEGGRPCAPSSAPRPRRRRRARRPSRPSRPAGCPRRPGRRRSRWPWARAPPWRGVGPHTAGPQPRP